MNSEMASSMKFVKPDNWDELIAKVDSLDTWKGVCVGMFEDGRVTRERLLVLEIAARDVGNKYPDIREAVWCHYCDVWSNLEPDKPNQRLFGMHSVQDTWELMKNVTDVLLSLFLET